MPSSGEERRPDSRPVPDALPETSSGPAAKGPLADQLNGASRRSPARRAPGALASRAAPFRSRRSNRMSFPRRERRASSCGRPPSNRSSSATPLANLSPEALSETSHGAWGRAILALQRADNRPDAPGSPASRRLTSAWPEKASPPRRPRDPEPVARNPAPTALTSSSSSSPSASRAALRSRLGAGPRRAKTSPSPRPPAPRIRASRSRRPFAMATSMGPSADPRA